MSHYGDSDVDSEEENVKDKDESPSIADGSNPEESVKTESNSAVPENAGVPVNQDEENDTIDDKIVDTDTSMNIEPEAKNGDAAQTSENEEEENENQSSGSEVMEVDDASSGKPAKPVKRYSCDSALAFARKIQNLSEDDHIELPPEPEGSCSPALQEKIRNLYEQKIRGGGNLIYAIQSRKDFRNPSIYEKFLLLLGIEERGTNFPKSDYDPDF